MEKKENKKKLKFLKNEIWWEGKKFLVSESGLACFECVWEYWKGREASLEIGMKVFEIFKVDFFIIFINNE